MGSVPDAFREAAGRALQQRQTALHVQGFRQALEALLARPSYTWYEGDDIHLGTFNSIVQGERNTVSEDIVNQLGVYRNLAGEVFQDIVEMNLTGRYAWWSPTPVIP